MCAKFSNEIIKQSWILKLERFGSSTLCRSGNNEPLRLAVFVVVLFLCLFVPLFVGSKAKNAQAAEAAETLKPPGLKRFDSLVHFYQNVEGQSESKTDRMQFSSVQFKWVFMRSKKPLLCAPPRLSDVSPTLPLKQFRCSSQWLTMALSRPFKDARLTLPLSTPLSKFATVSPEPASLTGC